MFIMLLALCIAAIELTLGVNSFHHSELVGDLKLFPSSLILVRCEDFAIIPPTTFQVG